MIEQRSIDDGCQACGAPFSEHIYDARTKHGRWGFLCSQCFKELGVGLGTGKGQKYDINTRQKLEG